MTNNDHKAYTIARDIIKEDIPLLGGRLTNDIIGILRQSLIYELKYLLNVYGEDYKKYIRDPNIGAILKEYIKLSIDDTNDPYLFSYMPKPVYTFLLAFSMMRFNIDIITDMTGDKKGFSVGMDQCYLPKYVPIGEYYDDNIDKFIDSLLKDSYYDSVDNIELRIIYSDVIAQIANNYPLSSYPKKFIRDTIMSMDGIRFSSKITDKSVFNIPKGKSIYAYYNKLEDISDFELHMKVYQLRTDGAYGRIFHIKFADNIDIFGKINSRGRKDIVHEYRIGLELNKLYDECPFLLYTYGLSNIYMEDINVSSEFRSIRYIPVADNRSRYGTMGNKLRSYPLLMTQWLEGSMSLHDFISTKSRRCMAYDENGRIVRVSYLYSISMITMAVLSSLKYLWKEIGFVHNDLHFNNIQLVKMKTPQVIKLPGYNTYFNLDHVPIIIDYGFCCALKKDIIVPMVDNIMLAPYNDKFNTDQKYIIDVYEYLISMLDSIDYDMTSRDNMSGHSISEYQEFRNNILGTLYTSFTGHELDHYGLDELFKYFSNIVRDRYDYRSVVTHMIPVETISYNPDKAIDTLIYNWIDRIPFIPRGYDGPNIDNLINDMVNESGREIEINTYSGAIVSESLSNKQSDIKFKYEYDDSLSELIDINKELYSFYSDKNLGSKFNRALRAQYNYRSSVNELIERKINGLKNPQRRRRRRR